MPRALTPSVLALLRHPQAEFVHLIEAEFSGGTLRFTTGAQDVSWNGQTWTAIGGRLEIGAVSEDADLRGQGTELVLSAVDQAILATLLSNNYRGRPLRIWRAYLWQEDNLVGDSLDMSVSPWAGLATLTPGVRDPFGGLNAFLVTDDDAATFEVRAWPFASNALPARSGVGFWTRFEGDTEAWRFELSDLTAGVNRDGVAVTFAANGVPTVNPVNGGVVVDVSQGAGGWWHVRATLGITTPANAHQYRVITSGGAAHVGTIGVYGMHLVPRAYAPTLFSPTSGVAALAGRVVPDPIPVFSGLQLEPYEMGETRERDGGTAIIRTRLASRLAAFGYARGIRANPTSHQHHYPGDTFFQHSFGLANRKIYWGTERPVDVGGGTAGPPGNEHDADGRQPFEPV